MGDRLILSTLGHTWILDLDGTLVKHNGYIVDGYDTFLDGARAFLQKIPDKDMVIFITSRKAEARDVTEAFLMEQGIRFDHIIFDAPYGERILINDDKPSGLRMSIGIQVERDQWRKIQVEEDETL